MMTHWHVDEYLRHHNATGPRKNHECETLLNPEEDSMTQDLEIGAQVILRTREGNEYAQV